MEASREKKGTLKFDRLSLSSDDWLEIWWESDILQKNKLWNLTGQDKKKMRKWLHWIKMKMFFSVSIIR